MMKKITLLGEAVNYYWENFQFLVTLKDNKIVVLVFKMITEN